MNKIYSLLLVLVVALSAFAMKGITMQQGPETWTQAQLMPPAELARSLKEGSKVTTYIYNIGPSGYIKNSIDIGEGREKPNIEKLKKAVSGLPKDARIVIYCGCCPFKNCPNVRPAFKMLSDQKFTNHKLLNLPNNLKVDWIDKGYPMQ